MIGREALMNGSRNTIVLESEPGVRGAFEYEFDRFRIVAGRRSAVVRGGAGAEQRLHMAVYPARIYQECAGLKAALALFQIFVAKLSHRDGAAHCLPFAGRIGAIRNFCPHF